MAGITTFLDPAQLPGRTQEQKTFDTAVAYVMQNWPTWGAEVNATWAAFNAALAGVNAIAAGGAYAIPFVYSSNVTVADPGARYMRLDNASPYSAGQLVLSTTSAAGKAITQLVGGAMSSTNSSKASIRISSLDGDRYVVYRATAIALPTAAYIVLAVSAVSSQGANFINGETLLMFVQPSGDKGDKGDAGQGAFTNMVVLRSTQSWSAPAGKTLAKITVVDGGYSGAKKGSDATDGVSTVGGRGGNVSVSIRAITPLAAYTATVGAGGVASTALSAASAQPGGTSSFSGPNFTTLTSSNGDINAAGMYASDSFGGGNLLGPGTSGIGHGGTGGNGYGGAGGNGTAGAIIIEF